MTDLAAASRLTIRQRREMGLTVVNVTRTTRQLYKDGIITKDMSHEDVAELVMEQIVLDNPKAFADPALDWEAVLAFIQTILPLILQIIALF